MLRSILLLVLIPGIIFGAGMATPATAKGSASATDATAVILQLRPGASARALASEYQLRPGQVLERGPGETPVLRMEISDSEAPDSKAARIAADQRVVYAEPDYLVGTPVARQRSSWAVGDENGAATADDYTTQWAIAALGLDTAHLRSRGAGITVAILDTGIDATHPALEGRIVPGYDFIDDDADPGEMGNGPFYGHGTHVAGLVALVAPEAKIMPLRTLNADGVGTVWGQALALAYAIEHGAAVINLSWSMATPSRLLDDLLATATCRGRAIVACRSGNMPGAVVLAAAGNSGASAPEYPAASNIPGVLAIAASGPGFTLSDFTTYGSWVNLAAPGEAIVSTTPGGGYTSWSGSSMATPITAGALALVRSAASINGPAEVAARVTTSAHLLDNSPVRRHLDLNAALSVAR
jgi:subtilisin family serine protease